MLQTAGAGEVSMAAKKKSALGSEGPGSSLLAAKRKKPAPRIDREARERDELALHEKGLGTVQIAAQLGLDRSTVSSTKSALGISEKSPAIKLWADIDRVTTSLAGVAIQIERLTSEIEDIEVKASEKEIRDCVESLSESSQTVGLFLRALGKKGDSDDGQPTMLWRVLVALMESNKLSNEEIAEVVVQAVGSDWETCETLPPGLAPAIHAALNSDGRSKLSDVPKEPELVQLWRQVIEIRDSIVRNISKFESADHPERQYLEYVEFVSTMRGHPSPSGTLAGRGQDQLQEADAQAARVAKKLRKRLDQINDKITGGTRDKDRPSARGISIGQLRELVEEEQLVRVAVAKAKLEAWLRARDDKGKRHFAQVALYQAIKRTTAVPTDFGQLLDLDKLREEDSAERRTRSSRARTLKPRRMGELSGDARKISARIIERVLKRWV